MGLIKVDYGSVGGGKYTEVEFTKRETITGTVTSEGYVYTFNEPSGILNVRTKRGSVTTQPKVRLFYPDGTPASDEVYMANPNTEYTLTANSPVKITDSIIVKVTSGSNFNFDTASIDYMTPSK